MGYDGKLLARARERLGIIRSENEAEQQRRIGQVYAKAPQIKQMDMELRSHMADLVRITISRPADMARKLDELKDANLDLQMKRAEALVENGFAAEYTEPIYSCPKCGDTGEYNGGICSCLEKLYNAELTRELGTLLKTGDESFDKFDLSLYSDRMHGQSIPRNVMSATFSICRKYADAFPLVAANNLLLYGSSGLGKTYLSACIARTVAEKGFSVCYDTAVSALGAYEKQRFARDPAEAEEAAAKVRHMSDCDLMILDDLGTEIPGPFTVSALYTLVNTRLVNGRYTIISTNLMPDELKDKYSGQIASRILGEYFAVPFVGEDIRLILKERNR